MLIFRGLDDYCWAACLSVCNEPLDWQAYNAAGFVIRHGNSHFLYFANSYQHQW